jgi:hypothetical protein
MEELPNPIDFTLPSKTPEVKPVISLNALIGFSSLQALKLIGYIKHWKIIILIDSGSTHNFIYPRIAQETNFYIHAVNHFQIMISNGGSMIQLAIVGHPPIPTGSSFPFLVQHVLLYFFVIVGFSLLGMYEAIRIFHVDIGGLSPTPTRLFCMFSCHHILLYFQGRFGGQNNVFLAHHSQTIDEVRV